MKGASKCQIVVKSKGKDRYTIGIVLDDVRVVRKAGTSTFWMVDYEGMLPIAMNCGGLPLKPKLILKLFRKLKPIEHRDLRWMQKFPWYKKRPEIL